MMKIMRFTIEFSKNTQGICILFSNASAVLQNKLPYTRGVTIARQVRSSLCRIS